MTSLRKRGSRSITRTPSRRPPSPSARGTGTPVFLNPEYLQDSSFENGVLAHEMGHIVTGATHRVDSPADLVERHEEQAERWAIRLMIPWRELESAVRSGERTVWELAEHFNVPEKMVRKALDYYALRGYHFQFKGEAE